MTAALAVAARRARLLGARLRAPLALAAARGRGAPAARARAPKRARAPAPAPCPYAAAQIIGQRAEGVLRFPEAVARRRAAATCTSPTSSSYVVQKFTAGRRVRDRSGAPTAAATGQFGPIGGLATDAAGNVYVVDSSHNRIEKFDAERRLHHRLGTHAAANSASSTSAPRRTPPSLPAAGSRSPATTCTSPTRGNNRIERFNLRRRRSDAVGHPRQRARPVLLPRGVAANESEVIVTDDDNHRIEKFRPEGAFEAAAGSHGSGPGQFGFPYGVALDAAGDVYVADDINHRVVKLNAAAGVRRRVGRVRLETGPARVPARAGERPGRRHLRRRHRQRPHRGVRPRRRLPAHARHLRARPRRADRAARPRGRPDRPAARLRHRSTTASRRSRRAATPTPGSGRAPAGTRRGFNAPAGIGDRPARIGLRRRRRQRAARAPVGRRHLPRRTRRPRRARRRAAERRRLGRRVRARPATTYVADTNHNRVLVYGPEGALQREVGRRRRRRRIRQRRRASSTIPSAVAVDAAGDVYVADTGNDRIVELSPDGRRARRMGLARHGRRALSLARPASPSTPPGSVYVRRQRKQPRRGVRRRAGSFLAKWGVRGDGVGEFSQPTRDRGGLQRRRVRGRHQQQPRRALRPASRRPPAAASPPAAWPPPLDVAPVLRVSLPRARRRARAPRARAGGQLPARLQDPRHRDAVRRRAQPRASRWSRRRARRCRPQLTGHVRLRVGAARAAAPAQRARRAPGDDGARDDRRRRADRPAHGHATSRHR